MYIDFLQSEEWRKFQEATGKRTFHISSQKFSSSLLASIRRSGPFEKGEDLFWANIIEYKLPIVGKYLYIPRGPVISEQGIVNSEQYLTLINLAKKENAGWIRFDANSKDILEKIRNVVGNAHAHSKNRNVYMHSLQNYKIIKAPHDMQPKEIFVINITKSEEELLAEMKEKTRYNIRLAEKKGVQIRIMNYELGIKNNYLDKFINLVKITAERNKITAHPEGYYRKMFEVIPKENLKLYVAEYQNKTIAANIVVFYGDTAIYLHGASDNEYRNVMAPYLLQWRQICDAKLSGCTKYDMGGVKTTNNQQPTTNNWYGITKFKLGFSPDTQPVEFAGSYDIVINKAKYAIYKLLQKIKSFV